MLWLKSLHGLCKTEFVNAIGRLDDEIAVDWETRKWVDWSNDKKATLVDCQSWPPVEYDALARAECPAPLGGWALNSVQFATTIELLKMKQFTVNGNT